jgi:hypothetical protein
LLLDAAATAEKRQHCESEARRQRTFWGPNHGTELLHT